MTKPPAVVFVDTSGSKEWMDEKGKVHRSRRSYYHVGISLPDRDEIVAFYVPVTPNSQDRIAAILEALS